MRRVRRGFTLNGTREQARNARLMTTSVVDTKKNDRSALERRPKGCLNIDHMKMILSLLLRLFVALPPFASSSAANVLPDFGLLPRLRFPGGIFSLFRNRCHAAYPLFVRFALRDFDYTVITWEDSVMQLAQAGTYVGPADIQEYGSFLTTESPFLKEQSIDLGRLDIRYAGYDDTGGCIFNLAFYWYHGHEGATNTYAASYNYPIMFKAFFNPTEKYATRINVFFAPGFFQFVFFQLFDSIQTRQYICSVYNGPCADVIDEELNADNDCESLLAALPMANGDKLWIDGNSQGCRALHAAFAEDNPTNHCAHISFQPQLDPKGNFKCQETEGVLPTDLFNAEDFEFWNEYCERNGFDPAIGHDEPECEYKGRTC
jgi:hypothetical protein